jgi:hypothetical protein
MKDKQFPGKMDRTSERKYKTTYPMKHGKKLKHVKMFENFDVNENIEIVYYTEVIDNFGRTESSKNVNTIEKVLTNSEDWTDDMKFEDKAGNIYFIDDLIGKDVKLGNKIIRVDENADFDQEYLVRDAENIPVLSDDAKWPEVEKYLKWLRTSEYAYHIDDDPHDIDSFSKDVQEILSKNSDIMWNHDGNKIWDVYSGGDAEIIRIDNTEDGEIEHVVVSPFIPYKFDKNVGGALAWLVDHMKNNEDAYNYIRTEVGTADTVRVGNVKLSGSDVQDHLKNVNENRKPLVQYQYKASELFFGFVEPGAKRRLSLDELVSGLKDLELEAKKAEGASDDQGLWFRFSAYDTLATTISDIERTLSLPSNNRNRQLLIEQIRDAISLNGELSVYLS